MQLLVLTPGANSWFPPGSCVCEAHPPCLGAAFSPDPWAAVQGEGPLWVGSHEILLGETVLTMGSGAGAGSLGLAPGLAIGTGPGKVLPSAPSAPLTFKDGTALALSCMADYGGPVFPFLAVGGYKGKPGGPGGGQRGGHMGQGQCWERIVMGSCCLGVAGPSRGWRGPWTCHLLQLSPARSGPLVCAWVPRSGP